MAQQPLVICSPQPAGDSRPDEYYLYSGAIASLARLHTDQLRKYEAIDDGDPPGVYHLPYVHGWLLEFQRLFGRTCRWVVFSRDNQLYLDDGVSVLSITAGEVAVRVRRFGCLVRMRVFAPPAKQLNQFWIRIPLLRLIFWDPAVSANACEPLCELFAAMEAPSEMEWWREAFRSGIAHRSLALRFVRSIGAARMSDPEASLPQCEP